MLNSGWTWVGHGLDYHFTYITINQHFVSKGWTIIPNHPVK